MSITFRKAIGYGLPRLKMDSALLTRSLDQLQNDMNSLTTADFHDFEATAHVRRMVGITSSAKSISISFTQNFEEINRAVPGNARI